MADFDPYYQWLAIPPKDQPPNHYRLLGVELFESNADVIANAADQRMTHLRSFQTGKYADLSQKLLNEVAVAKICLLNPEKKTVYDRQLRGQSTPPLASPPPLPVPPTDRPDFSGPPPIAPRAVPPAIVKPERLSDKRHIKLGLALLAGTALVLAILLIVKLGRGGKEVASAESGPASSAIPTEPWHELPTGETPDEPPAGETRHRQDAPATVPPAAPPREHAKPKPSASLSPPLPFPLSSGSASAPAKPRTSSTEPSPSPFPPFSPSSSPSSGSASVPADAPPKAAVQPKTSISPSPPLPFPPSPVPAARPQEKPQNLPAPVPRQEKLPVPDEAAQKQAVAAIREIYKAGYRAADKVALAEKLLEKADESRNDATGRFALLQEVRKLAVDAGQGRLGFEVIDALASEYQIAAAEMKAEVIEQAGKKFHSPQDRKAVAEAALEVVDAAIAEDDFDVARRMGKLANQVALPARDRELIQRIVAKNKEVEAAAKASAEAKAAMATLKQDPSDPDANLVAGKYLCISKGDWEKGLPMLARSSNAALQALAESDARGAATPAGQVKLGDAWWAVRGKQRAAYWYEKALPWLKTLERERVTGRILTEPFGRRAVDLLAWVVPEKDDADGKWGKWARNEADVVCTSFPPLIDGKQEDWATLALPVEVNGQYDLLVSFTRNKIGEPGHDEILIDFPVGLHSCALALGELGTGLGNIDGKNCYRNATTTTKAKLADGRRYTLLLRVRRIGDSATIDVLLDNQSLIHWQGVEAALCNINPYIQVPALQPRFFLSTRSLATFHSAELRMVSGQAKWAM